jgi:S-formylglutathione hydrolase
MNNVLVAGHRVDLFEPTGDCPKFALLFLHDEDGVTLGHDTAAAALFQQHRLACLCPHAGGSWWSDRLSSDFDPNRSAENWLVEDVLPVIASRWSLPPRTTALVGVGMGGQGALRLGFKHPELFPIVGALNAAIDHYELYGSGTPLDQMYPSREHCRQDSAILHIHPVRQPAHIWFAADRAQRWFRGNDRLHEKLAALGVAHHFLDRASGLEALVDFLVAALQQQSRRLL